MKNYVALLLISLTIISCAAQKKEKVKGDRDVITVSGNIEGSFNQIEISDNLEVLLSQGETNSYLLTTDKNLVESVQFSVVDSTLKIYTLQKITRSKKLKIDLTIIDIKQITLKNDVRLTTNNRIVTSSLKITGNESCKFDVDVQADELTVIMQGSNSGKLRFKGKSASFVMNDKTELDADAKATTIDAVLNDNADLSIDGDTETAKYNLRNSSQLNAKRMKASSVFLNATNKSDVYLNAQRNLEVFAKGKSEIYVYGKPEINVTGLSDKSKIIKK